MKAKAHTIYKLEDGTRVAGCTTVVGILAKPALIEWANKLGLAGIEVGRYVDNLADIGTLAHDMVICHLRGIKADTTDYSANQISQAENACLSFFEWLKNRKVDLIDAEKPLVSEIYRFGGTYDIIANVDGANELIDLKTGSGIYPEHLIQVAGGYSLLLEENGFSPDRIRILNIPRTQNENWGEVVVGEQQRELNKELFLACLKVYNLQKACKGGVIYAKKHN